jgi:hypothetical protein
MRIHHIVQGEDDRDLGGLNPLRTTGNIKVP